MWGIDSAQISARKKNLGLKNRNFEWDSPWEHSAPGPTQNYFLDSNSIDTKDKKWTTSLEKLPGSCRNYFL